MAEFERPGEEYGRDRFSERPYSQENEEYQEPSKEYYNPEDASGESDLSNTNQRENKTESTNNNNTYSQQGSQNGYDERERYRKMGSTKRSGDEEGDEVVNVSERTRDYEEDENSSMFAQSFCGEPDRGYNIFFARLEEGRRSLKHLAKHMEARIEIEDEYAKKLSKWSREGHEHNEVGSLQAAMELAFNQFDSISHLRMKMVNDLNDRVLAPIKSFMQHYKHIRESRRDSLLRSIKNREEQERNVLKSRKHYDTKCHDAEQVSIQQKKTLLESGPGKAGKGNPKLERSHTAVEIAEREYRLSEEKLRLLTTSWENDMIQFAEDFQNAENEHITQIKSFFYEFCKIFLDQYHNEINGYERVQNGFSQVNNLTVLREFVNQNSSRRKTEVTEIERSRPQTELLPTSAAVSGKDKSVIPFDAKVVYSYKAQKPEELSLEEGSLVHVTSTKDAPWWEGEYKGSKGVFPSNYVARVA